MSDIRVEFLAPSDLTPAMRDRMYHLMDRNYHGVSRDAFERDLLAKDVVMLGTDRGVPGGFTTARRFTVDIDTQRLAVLFSGDTIIDRPYRGCAAWSFRWLEYVLRLERETPEPLWWMLTSKGHLTYRYLSLWFRRFYPSVHERVPAAQRRLMSRLGREYAGDRFDAATLVVRHPQGQRLRQGVGGPTARHETCPHTRYFLQANPGWAEGDELLCIAQIAPTNLRASVARRFLAHSP